MKSYRSQAPESIRVGINIRSLSEIFNPELWRIILNGQAPEHQEVCWFAGRAEQFHGRGVSFIYNISIFGESKFRIFLDPSPLLTQGFVVEYFNRIKIHTHHVLPTPLFINGAVATIRAEFNCDRHQLRSRRRRPRSRSSRGPVCCQNKIS